MLGEMESSYCTGANSIVKLNKTEQKGKDEDYS